jgi:tetratricopeptide (TPR) repeat protein
MMTMPNSSARWPYHLAGWTYAIMCVGLVAMNHQTRALLATADPVPAYNPPPAPTSEAAWFRQIKPYCNSVEVQSVARRAAPPATPAGAGYYAACFALAGKIDEARRIIDKLTGDARLQAVSIVFDVGHPVADAGDDRSAGPIMELVVDYWPNHYMALYHAGIAEYMLGQRDLARHSLQEFLKYYHESDGWTSNARTVLSHLSEAEAPPIRRLPEPPG